MGLFDLFGREQQTRSEQPSRQEFEPSFRQTTDGSNGPISVFSPTSYDDVEYIIDAIKAGKNAVVHLTSLKTETALRIIDMLSGAIYALGGGVCEVGKNIFMFSLSGVEVR